MSKLSTLLRYLKYLIFNLKKERKKIYLYLIISIITFFILWSSGLLRVLLDILMSPSEVLVDKVFKFIDAAYEKKKFIIAIILMFIGTHLLFGRGKEPY